MAGLVLGARIGGIDLVRLALGVLGHHGIDLAVDRAGLEVLRPVHRRRAELIGRQARLDHHLALVGEAVLRRQAVLAMHQRQPVQVAIGVELGDRQLAVVEQVLVGLAVVGIERALGHEAVEVFEVIVVSQIDDDTPVLVDDGRGAFVRKAAERGALHRRGSWADRDRSPPPSRSGWARSAPCRDAGAARPGPCRNSRSRHSRSVPAAWHRRPWPDRRRRCRTGLPRR